MLSKEEILFPYENIRDIQDDLIVAVKEALDNKTNLIVHAPTGLGKTAAVLSPSLKFAIEKGFTVFFLTSKHTQHQIVIETARHIKDKYGIEVKVADLIGKKWMCLQENVDELYSMDFHDYCKSLVDDYKCEYYSNVKTKAGSITTKAKKLVEDLRVLSPMHTESLIEECKHEKFCPYEISSIMAKEANVIVADYYYIFHPSIRNFFFQRTGKDLAKSIIIVDEAHNLPKRCQQMLTNKLSNAMIERAISEAEKFKFVETLDNVKHIRNILIDYSARLKSEQEMLISKEDFMDKIQEATNYENLVNDLNYLGDSIREAQKISYLGGMAKFLDGWQNSDDRFSRILSKSVYNNNLRVVLTNKCLDASIVTKEVIDSAYSTIAISGTLTPTSMYRDLLGFQNTVEKTYKSPFPQSNRLNLIVPSVTTKYTRRDTEQYKKIAGVVKNICNSVKGNIAAFFPSYYLRDEISSYIVEGISKTVVNEVSGLDKKQKFELLERFKSYKDKGAILLGVSSASFGEGIDLPGEFLNCVIIVGLPLERPGLEIKELIRYYDKKFKKGWDYGYIVPALNRTFQNAGRCIRSETDKGVIVFLDERYSQHQYRRIFPPEWEIKVTEDYVKEIKGFYGRG